MGSYYEVRCSDLREKEDVVVATRVNRASAQRICAGLNVESVAVAGPCGPLYYLERVEDYHTRRTRTLLAGKVGRSGDGQ